MEIDKIKQIACELGAENVLDAKPFGDGHINDTYLVTTSDQQYILQKVNTDVFENFDGAMDNIKKVTEHLIKKGKKTFQVIGYKKPWRLISFIDGTYSLYVLENKHQVATGAKAFASFQNDLSDLPSERLVEVIPDFHNTVFRMQQLEEAIANDVVNRLNTVTNELEFINERKHKFSKILDLIDEKKIPIRITHNDAKINNVMLDNETNEAVAVVDLDTVMPGCVLYDFGDMVRTATASAEENEADLDKVFSKPEYFESLVKGYMSEAKFLNQYEIDNLVFSGWLITIEQAIRFLNDYLIGDIYYKINFEKENLIRVKNQIKMVKSLEYHMEDYEKIVKGVKL